jgi:putative transposase
LGVLLGATDRTDIQLARRNWAEEGVRWNSLARDSCWSESLAVGDENFVVEVMVGLGFKGRNRTVKKGDQGIVLREIEVNYTFLPRKLQRMELR